MTVNNVEKRENFESNGKFAKGNNVAKGKRNRTQTDKLLFALKKEGAKQKKDFWDAVAEAAFGNREIMKAVINKLVPTVNEFTGAGGEPIRYIIEPTYEKPEEGNTKEKEEEIKEPKESKGGEYSGL